MGAAIRAIGLAVSATLAVSAGAQQVAGDATRPYPRALAAGIKALGLCEGIFAAGRSEAQIAATELRGIYPEYDPIVPTLTATVDRTRRSVTVAWDPKLAARRADWYPRIGCVLSPIGGTRTLPPPLRQTAPTAGPDPRRWPIGDAGIAPRPSRPLTDAVGRAFDAAAYGAGSVTTGVVVVRDGRIVAERYAAGFGPFVPNRTWSVGKSIAGTLVGIAAHDLGLDPMKPAPVPEWSAPGDPRAAITLDELLRMASGLHSDTAGNRTDALYFGGTSVTEQAPGWPLEAAPGSRFRYANNDILLAVRAIRAAMKDDARYAAWPTETLLSPIGMRHTTTGTDWQRNFILSSQVWSTARDLARLGELWRGDGVWAGKRILPAGWVRYMSTPSGPQPAEGPGYGATLWLFGPEQGLPAGSYAAQGNRGQYVMIVPSERLVVVRRGEDPGTRFDIARFTADVIAERP